MSVFGDIVSAIMNKARAAGSVLAETISTAAKAATGPTPLTREQAEEMIQKIASSSGRQNYNWKQSIVDLMKLLDINSSLNSRKALAKELGYAGALDGSADMNIWLHKQVMAKFMEGGGKVPESLKD